MDISSIITVFVIIAFTAYLISSTRSYNLVRHRQRTQGPAQVIESLLHMVDDDIGGWTAFIKEPAEEKYFPPNLVSIIDDFKIALGLWAELAGLKTFYVKTECATSFVNNSGLRTHYVLTLTYLDGKGKPVSVEQFLNVNKLGQYGLFLDAHINVLKTMQAARG